MIRHITILLLCIVASLQPRTIRANITLPADTSFLSLPAAEYAIGTDGSLPLFTTQIEAGREAGVSGVELHYPVFAPLTKAEVERLRRSGAKIDEEVKLHFEVGKSRRQTLVDVSFTPIVRRQGRLMRITSCRIVPTMARPSVKAQVRAGNTPATRWAARSVLAEGRWVKISVTLESIYALTPDFLRRAGFNDPARVRLYGQGGRILEEDWTFTGRRRAADDLEEIPLRRLADGTALFFAEGTVRLTLQPATGDYTHENNPYSRASYYFLTEGDTPATMAETRLSGEGTTTPIEQVRHCVVLDTDEAAIYPGGRELYDNHNFANGNRRSIKMATPGLVTDTEATVAIGIAAANANSSTKASLTLGETEIGTLSIPKYGKEQSGYEARQSFKTKALTPENTFTITTGGSDITARLNYLRLNYRRGLKATDAPFSFSPNREGKAVIRIAEANAGTELWQIGRAGVTARRWTGTLSGGSLDVAVADAAERFVIADITATYPTPTIEGEVPNQNLHADAATDMVIIIPASSHLSAEAERLASVHRTLNGLRVNIVRADQIYNEFSSGAPDASAYRRYMKMLYDRAATDADLPRYLLLFGACAWDNRMLTTEWSNFSPEDYLLAFEVNNNANTLSSNANKPTSFPIGKLDSYVTDDYYGWLDDEEGTDYKRNKLDIAIGRFPCEDAETARIMVDKTIAYLRNEKKGAWKNKVYILGDDINNTLHMEGAESTAKQITAATKDQIQISKVYWDAQLRTNTATGYSYPQTARKLREAMARGALMFNYTGHGSPDQISHARLLLAEDFDIDASGRLPLWVMASCEISPYDTRQEDIGRIALANPTGGAFAVMCASRSVYSNYNEALNDYFSQLIFSTDAHRHPLSIGEALRQSKVKLLSQGGDPTVNKLKYVLLGDPAVALAAPRRSMVIDELNGKAVNGTTVRLEAGSTAQFGGYVLAEGGGIDATFNGTVTGSLFDRMETITCKNNSGDEKVMVYKDRTKMVFEGSDSVRAGRFTLTIPIPRDISYTDDTGRLYLYAAGEGPDAEAHGFFEQFCLNGTDPTAPEDTLSPEVFIYLNDPDFPDGGIVPQGAIFMADISDDCGINASGISMGHDFELCIDNNPANIQTLNDYFTYDFGSYRAGRVAYPLPTLTPGAHELTFRVWDVNNNTTTRRLRFHIGTMPAGDYALSVTQNPARVQTGLVIQMPDSETARRVRFDVYDVSGRRVWTHTSGETSSAHYLHTWHLTDTGGARVPSGLYLCRATVIDSEGEHEAATQRLIILRP